MIINKIKGMNPNAKLAIHFGVRIALPIAVTVAGIVIAKKIEKNMNANEE